MALEADLIQKYSWPILTNAFENFQEIQLKTESDLALGLIVWSAKHILPFCKTLWWRKFGAIKSKLINENGKKKLVKL